MLTPLLADLVVQPALSNLDEVPVYPLSRSVLLQCTRHRLLTLNVAAVGVVGNLYTTSSLMHSRMSSVLVAFLSVITLRLDLDSKKHLLLSNACF